MLQHVELYDPTQENLERSRQGRSLTRALSVITRAFRNVISTGYENLDGTPDLQEPHLAASVHSKAQAALDPRERAPESTDRAVF